MSKRKSWSYSAGEKGRNRVRVFERTDQPGIFTLQYSVPGGRPGRQALGRISRDQAKLKADTLAAEIAATPSALPMKRVTLGAIVDRYLREVTASKRAEVTRRMDASSLTMWVEALGANREPSTLDLATWQWMIRERRAGRISPCSTEHGKRPSPVGAATVISDLRPLRSAFRWACMVRDSNGRPLLDRNPIEHYPTEREKNPRQARITAAEYDKMLAVAPRVGRGFWLALVLARETGHRASAIRHLRWSDVDLTARTIHWRGESDKCGFAHTTPISDVAVQALTEARQHDPAVGDRFIFVDGGLQRPRRVLLPATVHAGIASAPIANAPVRESTFLAWWRRAEDLAGLPRQYRLGWHSLRRLLTDELRGAPLKDVAALMGWRSTRMALEVYQRSTIELQRDAFALRRSLTERAS